MSRVLVVAVVACIGCMQGPNNRAVPGEPSVDGALRFASPDELFAAVERVGRSSPEELDAWERSIGFRSMRREFNDLMVELAETPETARASLLASNADLLDPGSAEPARRVRAHAYASLIDRRGILYVGSVVHKVTTDEVLTWPEGDPAPLENSVAPSTVHAFRYTGSDNILGVCGTRLDGRESTDDRRVSYSVQTYRFVTENPPGNTHHVYVTDLSFEGQRRFLGSWMRYETTYQLYNFGVEMDGMRVVSSNGNQTQYEYVTQTVGLPYWETSNDSPWGFLSMVVGDVIHNPAPEQPVEPSFNKVHMEVTSRGTFPYRGILECEFCGDGTCQPAVGESARSCPGDCAFCGDGVCTEDPSQCSADCFCGNGSCDSNETYWDCWDCPSPCLAGDDLC